MRPKQSTSTEVPDRKPLLLGWFSEEVMTEIITIYMDA
jgi:hypothetical protein